MRSARRSPMERVLPPSRPRLPGEPLTSCDIHRRSCRTEPRGQKCERRRAGLPGCANSGGGRPHRTHHAYPAELFRSREACCVPACRGRCIQDLSGSRWLSRTALFRESCGSPASSRPRNSPGRRGSSESGGRLRDRWLCAARRGSDGLSRQAIASESSRFSRPAKSNPLVSVLLPDLIRSGDDGQDRQLSGSGAR